MTTDGNLGYILSKLKKLPLDTLGSIEPISIKFIKLVLQK